MSLNLCKTAYSQSASLFSTFSSQDLTLARQAHLVQACRALWGITCTSIGAFWRCDDCVLLPPPQCNRHHRKAHGHRQGISTIGEELIKMAIRDSRIHLHTRSLITCWIACATFCARTLGAWWCSGRRILWLGLSSIGSWKRRARGVLPSKRWSWWIYTRREQTRRGQVRSGRKQASLG